MVSIDLFKILTLRIVNVAADEQRCYYYLFLALVLWTVTWANSIR